MNYSRFSPGSDVYVYRNDNKELKGYYIRLPYFKRLLRDQELVEEIKVDGPMKAATVLMMLKNKGYLVPQRAINELVEEARAGTK
mgnify:CR=1 FL=1